MLVSQDCCNRVLVLVLDLLAELTVLRRLLTIQLQIWVQNRFFIPRRVVQKLSSSESLVNFRVLMILLDHMA